MRRGEGLGRGEPGAVGPVELLPDRTIEGILMG